MRASNSSVIVVHVSAAARSSNVSPTVARSACALGGHRRGPGVGPRHRHRHRARGSGQGLRRVPAGRQVQRPVARGATGLGLTLAKRFIELHGGRIWIESEVDTGTTFTFAIPVGGAAPPI
ncbi:MAG TPA: hypothetical protein DCK98_09850 [Chloroflexi bacterium]|nr:hypothetical protein [Chloroflexota bacterium]